MKEWGDHSDMLNETKQKKLWIMLICLLALFILISYFLIPDRPDEYPAYAVESPAPMGTKGFYQWLKQLDLPVEQWSAHPSQLADSPKDEVLVMIEPPIFTDVSETDGYLSFVEAGNTLIVAKHNPTGLFDIETNYSLELSDGPQLIQGTDQFEVMTNTYVRLVNEQDKILLEDDGGIIALERSFGDGKLIILLEPAWFTNQAILDYDHLQAVLGLVDFEAYQTIYFDTYSHESALDRSIFSVYPPSFFIFSLGLLLITISVLWMRGKRFGPIEEPRVATVRFSDERLAALANWQLKAKNYQEALLVQEKHLKQTIQERTGISSQLSWQELSPVLTRLLPNQTQQSITDLVKDLETLMVQSKISKQTFVTWSKRIDQIRNEVDEG